MRIELFDSEDKSLGMLGDDHVELAAMGVRDGMRLHVTDPTVAAGTFDQLADNDETANLYKLSEEEYAKREGM